MTERPPGDEGNDDLDREPASPPPGRGDQDTFEREIEGELSELRDELGIQDEWGHADEFAATPFEEPQPTVEPEPQAEPEQDLEQAPQPDEPEPESQPQSEFEPEPTDATEPLANYRAIRSELEQYNLDLGRRPEIVAVSKRDLPSAVEVAEQLSAELGSQVFAFSAVTGEGLDVLLRRIVAKLDGQRTDDI